MTEAEGPGHVAFSRDAPGKLIAIPLNPGQRIDVREHVFLTATGNVTYNWFQPDIWYRTRRGDETETHFPMGILMDQFHAENRPGLLLLHGVGDLFVRTLKEGETIYVKPSAVLYKDPTVSMRLMIEKVFAPSSSFWSSPFAKYFWVRLTGPGKVAIQSADKHHHESLDAVVASSGDFVERGR